MSIYHRYLSDPAPIVEEYDERALLNHEARQALSIVLLTTEALQYEVFGPLTQSQHEALVKLYENATQLQRMIESMLHLLIQDQQERYNKS